MITQIDLDNAQPGTYAIVDTAGRFRRLEAILTSWASTTYQKQHNGTWIRVSR